MINSTIDIRQLKSISNAKTYKAGDVIIFENDGSRNQMYIILKGSVDIYKNYEKPGEIKIATLNPGDFFGEMSLFLNKARTATVVAQNELFMLEINSQNAQDFFRKQPGVTFSLIKALCARLDETNNAYQKLFNESKNKD